MIKSPFLKQDKIVNVASVPFRSPFRYPGGKTWFVPRLRQWLATSPSKPDEFIEPFTGGGIIGLTVAFEDLAHHVTLVELDHQVAAVWKTILCDDGEWLADRIVEFDFSHETVDEELEKTDLSTQEQAFQTILKNRVNRGGILAPGAGRVCSELAGDFLMTYSNDQTTQGLAKKYQLAMKEIAMKNTHHAKMTELLIGRDLSWDK